MKQKQRMMFETQKSCPLVRTTDPETSQMAAELMKRTGKAAVHRQLVLKLLRQHGPKTGRELDQLAGFDDHTLGKRFAELRRARLIEALPKRICAVKKTMMHPHRIRQ